MGRVGKVLLLDRLSSFHKVGRELDQPVGREDRFKAAFIDLVTIGAIAGGVSAMMGTLSVTFQTGLMEVNFLVVIWAIFTYLAIPTWLTGRTFGKYAANLKVVGNDGNIPTLLQTMIRSIVVWLPFALVIIAEHFEGFMWALVAAAIVIWLIDIYILSRLKPPRALHDLVSDTNVVWAKSQTARWMNVRDLGWSGVWGPAVFQCPRCQADVTTTQSAPDLGAERPMREEITCPGCGEWLTIYLFRPVPIDCAAPAPAVDNEAVCTQHPGNRAVATCEKSGDYCCSLCAVQFKGVTYSATWLAQQTNYRQTLAPFEFLTKDVDVGKDHVALRAYDARHRVGMTRIYYDKVDAIVEWETKRSNQYAGVFIVVVALIAGFIIAVELTPVAAIITIPVLYVGYSMVKKERMATIIRAGEPMTMPRVKSDSLGLTITVVALATAIWRHQQSAAEAWLSAHPGDLPPSSATHAPTRIETVR